MKPHLERAKFWSERGPMLGIGQLSFETLKFEAEDSCARITLTRPSSMNALSALMVNELAQCVKDVAERDEIRVLTITGSGRAFCCGADLKGVLGEVQAGDNTGFLGFLRDIQNVFLAIRALPKPTIAALNGLTLAGGLELAMTCDVVMAARSARLGDAHSNFGVLPGGGGSLLPRYVGEKKANYLLFSGDHWSAEAFREAGFVSQVVEDDDLSSVAEALAAKLAEKSPLVLQRMKEMVAGSAHLSAREAIALEMRHLEAHAKSADFLEGLSAFSEKRTPKYSGQ